MRFALRFLTFLTLTLATGSAAPVFVGVPTGSSSDHVAPTIPTGKTLILPISVYDDSGPQPTITVKSDKNFVFARVKTGNPLLKMHVKYSGSPSAYEGDLVFQLFQDLTPQAARYIGGFAQAGFYDGLIFHRLADLAGNVPGSGTPNIFQGGDPDIDSTSTTAKHGPGFNFNIEPAAPLIFSGRGQLAMANAGNDSNYQGTNGSQFFITDSNQPRLLDFHYTIFGQLTHGWNLLDGLRVTPRDSNDRPTSPVTITSASVSTQFTGADVDGGTHTYTDAVLVLSAIRPGTATITVTAGATTATFTATAVKDTTNDPPFFVPTDDIMSALEYATLPYHAVDLEYDHLNVTGSMLNNGTGAAQKGGYFTSSHIGTFPLFQGENASLASDFGFGYIKRLGVVLLPGLCESRQTLYLAGNPSYTPSSGGAAGKYTGVLQPLLSLSQSHPGFREGYDPTPIVTDANFAPQVTVGVAPVTPAPVVVTGAPGAALTGLVAGQFIDPDRETRPEKFAATINWGDGKNVSSPGTITYSSSPGAYHEFTVTGGTTYAKPGVYPVVVTLSGTAGWTRTIQSTAVITASPLVATASPLTLRGPALRQQQMAAFTDASQPGAASAYSATIDWGDGTLTAGQIVAAIGGGYRVLGAHSYLDPETYSTMVRVHKSGSTPDQDAIVWNRLILTGFAGQQHLPPFNQVHLSGTFGPAPLDQFNPSLGVWPIKQTLGAVARSSQTYLNLALSITNSGNLPSKPSLLTIYLARGTTLQRTAIKNAQGQVTTPADIPLAFGPLLPTAQSATPVPQTSVPLPSIPPGGAVFFTYKQNAVGDYRLRLPANETGTGYNVIADLQSNDLLEANEPVSQPVYGRLQGISVSQQVLTTSEVGTSASFLVSIDRKPTADITIPLTGSASEGTLNPDHLTFTASNWSSPQKVTVTGVDTASTSDTSASNYQISLGPVTSTDALYDGLIGPTVTVANEEANFRVAASPTQTAAATTPSSAAPTLTTTQTAPNNVGTITLTCNRQPSASVQIFVFVGNPKDGQVLQNESSVITFGPGDFATATSSVSKTFHIKAVHDTAHAGQAVTYSVSFSVSSGDSTFNGVDPVPVTVTNQN